MLRIRLRREGAKAQPVYRIVVAEREHPRDGRFIEIVGEYNPRTEPTYVKVDEARALHHLKNGAQPSEAVERLLKSTGTLERLERFRKGEPLETLVTEANTAASARFFNMKTRRDDTVGMASKGKTNKKAKAKEGS
ncbi:MAG: 30S ribosomal protein S16 [Chloroflexi bacterium]|nr:30S ribosomal protein S16 [Chloroflexota bacterium]MBI5830069.1 30S ribosomal protein S16 [Chloroflexota bacterium]